MVTELARCGFDIDLRDGEAREAAFVHVFLKDKVEHKRDYKCAHTGNLFVEYAHKGRPSGIAITTADYWAFEYEENCWLVVPTERLKRVARAAYRAGRRVKGGDGKRYDGVLVRIGLLTSHHA